MKSISLVSAITVAALAVGRPVAQVVFRSSVQYVTVDAVVTDKDDKPIENLGIGDFEISENGKPQKIADFQFVSIPAVSRNIPVNVAATPEPDVATNIPPSPNSRLFAVVVDDLHLIEQDLVRIKRVLTDLVNTFSPDDDVAIVFTSHSDMSVNFTNNATRIMAPINDLKRALGFGLDSLGTSEGSGGGKYTHFYAMSANATVRSVVRALAGSGHTRRAVFYVTAGSVIRIFDPDPQQRDVEYDDDVTQLFAEAKSSDVPIYTIDPRGNLTPDEAVRGGIGRIASSGGRSTIVGNLQKQRSNLSTIAVNTGGRAIVGASDMTRMISEVVRENGSYYVLGYYPEPFVADGKFHELKVHVKRDGARVRARSGYESPRAGSAAASPASSNIESALAAGVNVSGLALRAFAEPIASDGKKLTVAVTVEVNYPSPADGSNRFDDNLELKILALDPDAKTKVTAQRSHHFTGPAPPTGGVTFLINEVMQVPAQPLTLRVAVASRALGRAGTVQVPIDMPKESKGLTIGGIAVGFDGPKREAVMMPDAFADLIPFQPTTLRVFGRSDVLRLFGHVYWKDKAAQPSVSMTLTGPGGVVTTAPTLSAMKPAGDQQDAVIAAMLPIQGLAPGKYDLVIRATLAGGKPVSRDVLFEVK